MTQLGGLAWLGAWFVGRRVRGGFASVVLPVVAFFALYAALSVSASALAPAAGRVALDCGGGDAGPVAASSLFCVLNRNYAEPNVRDVLFDLVAQMPGGQPPTFLDASFPFLDGFPMLPHLSHDDGHKVDLAFFYRDGKGGSVPVRFQSRIGYFAFEQPRPGDPRPCAGRSDQLTMRWDMDWFPTGDFELDEARTARMIRLLAADPRVTKILLEPHLVERLGVAHPKVRFQGCRAARHDDHIHVEVR